MSTELAVKPAGIFLGIFARTLAPWLRKIREIDIQARNIEIDKTQQEIVAAGNKLKISEDRLRSLVEEMKGVKARIDEIEKQ